MMKRKICIALAAIVVATGFMATPAVAEQPKKSPDAASTPPAALTLSDSDKEARIRVILDTSVNQFPPEFRALSILTLGLTFSDLFGDAGQGGRNIFFVVKAFEANWKLFTDLTTAGTLPIAYRTQLNYDDISKVLPELVKALSNLHKNIYWRELYTREVEYNYDPSGRGPRNPDHKSLFQNFGLLDSEIFGNVQFAFLTLSSKSTVGNDGARPAVVNVLSQPWIDTVGRFSYYDLFTKSYEDVTREEYEAIALAIDYQVIRAKGSGL